jgi:hypothetical protein
MGIAITAAAYIVAAAGTGGTDKKGGDGVERVSYIVSQLQRWGVFHARRK